MRNRISLYIVIPVLFLLALALAACEKDRPVPTSTTATSQPPSGQALTAIPGSDVTQLPSAASTGTGSQTSPATPVPIGSSATTAPKQVETAVPTEGASAGSAGQSTTYKVQTGDTLAVIAKKFGVTTDAIIRLNSLADPDVLTVGQELKIPGQQASSGQGSSVQAGGEVYVIKKGDTLSSIAKRFGVPLADLQKLNNITNPDQIIVGQKLQIPASAAATPAASQGRTYVVQQGDTLFKIALRFGVTVAALQSANNISDPNKVYPGQVLKIP